MLLAGKGARGKAAGPAPPQHGSDPERDERSEPEFPPADQAGLTRLVNTAPLLAIRSLILTTIQANNMTFEVLASKLHCMDNLEVCLLERTDRTQITRGRISDDCTYVAVHEDVVRSKLPDDHRPQPATRHVDFSYREVDSGRAGVRAQSNCMFWKITPAVPLNPSDRNALVLYQINVNGLTPINARTVLSLKTGNIEALIPPARHVGSGEPSLQQREVRAPQRPE